MNKRDWSSAPKDAQFYSFGVVRKHDENGNEFYYSGKNWHKAECPESINAHKGRFDFELRPNEQERNHPAAACQYNDNLAPPSEWPASDERIDAIGQNGGGGEHYDSEKDQKDISATLDEREQTYGDFSVLSESVEQMESSIKSLPGWQKASPAHRESAHMIIQKLARAFNGNPHYSDSWHDIAGYAKLAEKECKQQ